MIDSKSN